MSAMRHRYFSSSEADPSVPSSDPGDVRDTRDEFGVGVNNYDVFTLSTVLSKHICLVKLNL